MNAIHASLQNPYFQVLKTMPFQVVSSRVIFLHRSSKNGTELMPL